MRLINADILKAEFTENFVEEYPKPLIMALIDSVPTVDAEPVKHGVWRRGENFGGEFRDCSVCNVRHYKVLFWKYCPNCGAKMDGESNDEQGEIHNQTQ
jgi:hypothetical protein